MSDPLFVLDLGGGRYLDVRGALVADLPSDAVVFPKPPALRLEPGAMASALRDLTDPDLTVDDFYKRWQAAGQPDEFVQWLVKATNAATIIGGVLLSISQPPVLVAAVILGVIISAFASSNGSDPATEAELHRVEGLLKAKTDTDQAASLLAMYASVQGALESVVSGFGDVLRFHPTGAARLAAFAAMKSQVQTASPTIVQIRDNKWLGVYDPDVYKARFGLSQILCRIRPDGSLDPIPPQPPDDTRFDYRLGLPMLLYLAKAYPAMIKMAAPIYRSQGTYRDQLRALAAAVDGFVVRMQDECFSRTEHTAQSLFNHDTFPSALYFGSPFDARISPGGGGLAPPSGPSTFPVGAFDLVRYSDDFIWSRWSDAFASGGDLGLVGTFDYTWVPPSTVVDPVGRVYKYDDAATAANDRAKQDYARLVVVSGAVHLLIASALLRYLSAPPLASETVRGSAAPWRRLVAESPTTATSPVIFPNVQISAPATLKKYDARNTVRAIAQEPYDQPALTYRVVLRTIRSLFGKEAWSKGGYVGRVWTPALEPLPADAQNVRLRTDFVQGLVLGEEVLYDGVSPTEPLSLSSQRPVTLPAHTFDWYVPLASPPWIERITASAKAVHDLGALGGAGGDDTTPGGRSIHLQESLAPETAARLAGQPLPTLSYHGRTREALASVEEVPFGTLLEPSLDLAERRHVRLESITLNWQLAWQDGQLEVTLTGRPEDRSAQIFVVVEETVQSGEELKIESLHTPIAAELTNQLIFVPQSFFDDEKQALQAAGRLWDDLARRFAKSATVGPGDPVASAVARAQELVRESSSTATLAESLALRLDAVRLHAPELYRAALETLTRR